MENRVDQAVEATLSANATIETLKKTENSNINAANLLSNKILLAHNMVFFFLSVLSILCDVDS